LEHLFSGAGLTGMDRQNRLAPATFEVLQVLKSAYKNSFLLAHEEANAHMAHLWNNDIPVEDENSPF